MKTVEMFAEEIDDEDSEDCECCLFETDSEFNDLFGIMVEMSSASFRAQEKFL